MAWKGSRGWPKALEPCTYMGDLEEAPDSWLRIGLALAIVTAWGVNQRKDLPLCLFLSVYLTFR